VSVFIFSSSSHSLLPFSSSSLSIHNISSDPSLHCSGYTEFLTPSRSLLVKRTAMSLNRGHAGFLDSSIWDQSIDPSQEPLMRQLLQVMFNHK
jgi:hypothetical protein